ncbi:hypothetical protein EMIT0P294_30630 [Pseudomonas sp. IT-P294]
MRFRQTLERFDFRRLLGDDLLKLEILFGLQGGEPQSFRKSLWDCDNLRHVFEFVQTCHDTVSKRRAVPGKQRNDQVLPEHVLGLLPIQAIEIDASKSGRIKTEVAEHALRVAHDVLMLLAGEIGDLPARHGDRIAWSDDRVHNGPTVFYKLLKEPGCSPAFLCLEFRRL